MTNAERIIAALVAFREGRQPAVFPDGMQPVAAPGEDLVPVGLVAHIPHQPVVRCIENIMQSNRQLDRAQAGGEVTAVPAGPMQQERPHFLRQRFQLILG